MALQFNLLPWRDEIRAKKKKNASISMLAGIIVGLIVSGVIYLYKEETRKALVQSNTIYAQKQQQVEPKLKKMKELLALQEKLNQQITAIESLQANRSSVTHMVDELAKATRGKELYLSSFELKNGDVRIDGYAKTDRVISDLMKDLRASNWYLEPVLQRIVREEDLGDETKGFSITSRLVLPGNDNEMEVK